MSKETVLDVEKHDRFSVSIPADHRLHLFVNGTGPLIIVGKEPDPPEEKDFDYSILGEAKLSIEPSRHKRDVVFKVVSAGANAQVQVSPRVELVKPIKLDPRFEDYTVPLKDDFHYYLVESSEEKYPKIQLDSYRGKKSNSEVRVAVNDYARNHVHNTVARKHYFKGSNEANTTYYIGVRKSASECVGPDCDKANLSVVYAAPNNLGYLLGGIFGSLLMILVFAVLVAAVIVTVRKRQKKRLQKEHIIKLAEQSASHYITLPRAVNTANRQLSPNQSAFSSFPVDMYKKQFDDAPE